MTIDAFDERFVHKGCMYYLGKILNVGTLGQGRVDWVANFLESVYYNGSKEERQKESIID